ncbi:MAG: hypothetical protein QM785_14340 [Pyrinomonadaceae bacterium]
MKNNIRKPQSVKTSPPSNVRNIQAIPRQTVHEIRANCRLIVFPTQEVMQARKIQQLEALKVEYQEYFYGLDRIYRTAMEITGEEEANGHTQAFLENDRGYMTGVDLFERMERNPSHLW